MIAKNVKKDLQYTKRVTATSKYIVLYRGASVVIYDKHWILKKKILNLKYVYNGYVSPDEKTLLLVSNSNRIYIVSLDDFTVTKSYTVPKPYNYGLHGNACWCTSDSFMLPVQNYTTLLSTIRKMTWGSELIYEDFLKEKYWIIYIAFVNSKNQYLCIGLDRVEHSWNLIWFKDKTEYTIHKILNFDQAIIDIDVIDSTEQIILTGESELHCCHFNGRPSNVLQAYPRDIIENFGFPTFFKHSKSCPNTAYLGTYDALIVWDLKTGSIIKSYKLEYGARGVEEIEDTLLVSTWGTIKLLSLSDLKST